MSAFTKMINDLFNVADFIDFFYDYDLNRTIKCIRYDDTFYDTEYTEYGKNNAVNFYLCVKADDYTPVKNKRIKFQDVDYKIDNFSKDAYGLSWEMHLKSLTDK